MGLAALGACQAPPQTFTPTYVAQTAIPVSEHPVSLVAADFDHDGDVDLVVPGLLSHDFVVLENDGAGAFTAQPPRALPGGPLCVVSGHFDDDETTDLAVSLPSGNLIRILAGGPGLTFTVLEDVDIAEPGVLGAANLLGDDRDEILAAQFASGRVRVLAADAQEHFTVVDEQAGPPGLAAMTTSPTDLFFASGTINQIWRRSRADLQDTVVPVGRWPSWLTLGDLDGDGAPELVGAHNLADTLFWMEAGAAEPEVHEVPVGAGPFAVALGDLDDDGDLDAVATNKFENSVSVLANPGDGQLEEVTRLVTGDGPTPLAIADFDRDGRLDFVVVDGFSNDVVLYLAR